MGQVIDVPEGQATKTVYLVRYDEERWLRFSDKDKEYCQQTWIKKAEPCGVEEVVLQLFPDEVLPLHGHEQPYIVWRHKFKEVIEEKLSVISAHVRIRSTEPELNVNAKVAVHAMMAAYPAGTTYEVIFKRKGAGYERLYEGKVE